MPTISLKDILISARQEAHRMRHFYIGAEHLFIALLDTKGSITSKIVQEHGLTPEYVIDAVRRKIGKGSRHRLWAGMPNTPRADILLSIANDIAAEAGRNEITERDLLIAVLEENDSIAIRVFKALGISDMAKVTEMARTYTPDSDSQQPYVKVDFGTEFGREDNLTKDQLFLLRRMFYGYAQIRIERRLTGGYSEAALLIVTPIHVDNREDAPVVVKIDHVDAILDEAQRYESHVKTKLPAMTARIEDKPIAPETSDLAGIKYTLITSENRVPEDLRMALQKWDDAKRLGSWLENELFPTFGRMWWLQNRSYRFQVWREYDWMLPPILTLEMIREQELPPDARRLKMPLKRSKLQGLEYGDLVSVENFIVQKVYPEKKTILLAAGHGTESAKAYKIEVRNVDFTHDTYYRGEVVDILVGRIWKTRNEQLLHAIGALNPDFDPRGETIPVNLSSMDKLPNPISLYEEILEQYINGSLSTIHGDLHPGNIMLGPNLSAFLIDFAHTREGHTVFDWATLEISLLSDFVMPKSGETWADAAFVLEHIVALNGGELLNKNHPVTKAMVAIQHVRQIARECLAYKDRWSEYYVALAFSALRAVTWETMSIGNRRLMLLLAALSMHELRTRFRFSSETDTPSPEETDLNTA